MFTTEMTRRSIAIAAETSARDHRPIFMVNLLRYKSRAEYAGESDLKPCSGREAYFQRYVPAFGQLAEGSGIKPIWVGEALAGIVAPPDEHWDNVAIVEYPSFEAFRNLVESDAYKLKAGPHRIASLADWRLIATGKMDLPG